MNAPGGELQQAIASVENAELTSTDKPAATRLSPAEAMQAEFGQFDRKSRKKGRRS